MSAWGEGGTSSTLAPACRGRCRNYGSGLCIAGWIPARSEENEGGRPVRRPSSIRPQGGHSSGKADISHRETEHLRVLIANERRDQARTTNRKLVDVASAVVDGHRLLPKQPHSPAPMDGAGE